MAKVAVIYHSGYGHTAAQAKAVLRGAESVKGADARLLTADEAQKEWDYLDSVDAMIFGCPTYMGSGSAGMKAFLEASSKAWLQQRWKDKLAAGFTNSGSWSGDKLNTLVQLAIFAAQHSMIWVTLGLLPGNNSTKGSPEDLNRIGGFLGAMSQSNVDQGADDAPPKSDLQTAEHLGRRVAELAAKWAKAR